ncbi:MAG: YceI family protein [Bacteroidetes bacterium]|nr:MAG: YceI family protein [Bacteroidota bacterium]
MKRLIYVLGIAATIMMSSCGNSQKPEEKPQNHSAEQKPKQETCIYAVVQDSLKVYWTAFKHTAKVPVKGAFDTVTVTLKNNAETVEQILASASFAVQTYSVNSGDEGRDAKIRSFYFDKLANGKTIQGKILSAANGEADIELTINNIIKTVKGKYSTGENLLKLKTVVNMEDFNAQESIEALQEACKEKHTGSDGITKLWSEVEILAQVPYKKQCK